MLGHRHYSPETNILSEKAVADIDFGRKNRDSMYISVLIIVYLDIRLFNASPCIAQVTVSGGRYIAVPRRPHRTGRPQSDDRPTKELAVKWTRTPCACRSLRNRIIGWVQRSELTKSWSPSSSIDGCTIAVHCRRPPSLSPWSRFPISSHTALYTIVLMCR